MCRSIVLYKSLTPVQLAAVIRSGWRELSADSPEQINFYPKLHRDYADMIARMLTLANYSAAYVVAFRLPLSFLAAYNRETVAYDEHLEYRIPVSDLAVMNRHILGCISVVSAFSSEAGEGRSPDHNQTNGEHGDLALMQALAMH